jgi:plasmid stabilization system protein ParE
MHHGRVRAAVHGPYLVLYTIRADDAVVVERVFHAARGQLPPIEPH